MSTRARFYDTIAAIFDFGRHRDGRSIFWFALATAAFGCAVNGLYDCLAALVASLSLHKTGLMETFVGALPSWVILIVIAIWPLRQNFKRNRPKPASREGESPEPHPGLIAILSTYNARGHAGAPATAEELGTLLTGSPDLFAPDPNGSPSLWSSLMGTNWGPLAVAVKHHAPALKHCWVLCTEGERGSASQYDVAQRLVRAVAGREVGCYCVKVPSAHDIGSALHAICEVYHEAQILHDLRPDEIIADFTGGTSAMSGAMVLATVWEQCHVEYLRQDRLPEDVSGAGLSWEEIDKRKPLVAIETTHALVPQGSPAEA